MRLVDPVEWYMRRDENRPRSLSGPARGRRGLVAYAPLRDVGPDRDSDEVPDASAGPSESEGYPIEDWEERRANLGVRHRPYFEDRAREVVAGRPIAIRATRGTVRARLVRFRNGGVLECDVVTPRGVGHGMTRIDRRTLRDPIPIVADYLIDEVARLGPRAEPAR